MALPYKPFMLSAMAPQGQLRADEYSAVQQAKNAALRTAMAREQMMMDKERFAGAAERDERRIGIMEGEAAQRGISAELAETHRQFMRKQSEAARTAQETERKRKIAGEEEIMQMPLPWERPAPEVYDAAATLPSQAQGSVGPFQETLPFAEVKRKDVPIHQVRLATAERLRRDYEGERKEERVRDERKVLREEQEEVRKKAAAESAKRFKLTHGLNEKQYQLLRDRQDEAITARKKAKTAKENLIKENPHLKKYFDAGDILKNMGTVFDIMDAQSKEKLLRDLGVRAPLVKWENLTESQKFRAVETAKTSPDVLATQAMIQRDFSSISKEIAKEKGVPTELADKIWEKMGNVKKLLSTLAPQGQAALVDLLVSEGGGGIATMIPGLAEVDEGDLTKVENIWLQSLGFEVERDKGQTTLQWLATVPSKLIFMGVEAFRSLRKEEDLSEAARELRKGAGEGGEYLGGKLQSVPGRARGKLYEVETDPLRKEIKRRNNNEGR